jgi:hypothetical protein
VSDGFEIALGYKRTLQKTANQPEKSYKSWVIPCIVNYYRVIVLLANPPHRFVSHEPKLTHENRQSFSALFTGIETAENKKSIYRTKPVAVLPSCKGSNDRSGRLRQ